MNSSSTPNFCHCRNIFVHTICEQDCVSKRMRKRVRTILNAAHVCYVVCLVGMNEVYFQSEQNRNAENGFVSTKNFYNEQNFCAMEPLFLSFCVVFPPIVSLYAFSCLLLSPARLHSHSQLKTLTLNDGTNLVQTMFNANNSLFNSKWREWVYKRLGEPDEWDCEFGKNANSFLAIVSKELPDWREKKGAESERKEGEREI